VCASAVSVVVVVVVVVATMCVYKLLGKCV